MQISPDWSDSSSKNILILKKKERANGEIVEGFIPREKIKMISFPIGVIS